MGEEKELGNVEMKVGLVNTAIWSCVRVHLRVAGFPDPFVPMMSGDIGTSGKKKTFSEKLGQSPICCIYKVQTRISGKHTSHLLS